MAINPNLMSSNSGALKQFITPQKQPSAPVLQGSYAGINTVNVKPMNTAYTSPSQMGTKAAAPTNNIQKPNTTLATQYKAPQQTLDQQKQSLQEQLTKTSSGLSEALNKGYSGKTPIEYDQNGNMTQAPGGTINTQGQRNPYTVNNGLYGQIITGLANQYSQPSQDYITQQAEANKYNEALKQSRMNETSALAANASNPIPLEFQQGRGQVLQSQYAQEQAALGAGYQGAANLMAAANQQQGMQQQALGTAAGLTAPQQATPYGTFNPATGQYNQYGGGQGGGGAFTAGQVQGNVGQGQTYQQVLLPAYNAAGQIKNQLNSWLDSNPGINPSDVNVVNQLKGWVQGQQFSDARYPQLSQFLNEFMNTLTPIIGSPGEVTNYKQSIVNSLMNPTSSGASLRQQADSLYNIAGGKLNEVYRTGTQPLGNTSSFQEGQTAAGGAIVYRNGSWQPNK